VGGSNGSPRAGPASQPSMVILSADAPQPPLQGSAACVRGYLASHTAVAPGAASADARRQANGRQELLPSPSAAGAAAAAVSAPVVRPVRRVVLSAAPPLSVPAPEPSPKPKGDAVDTPADVLAVAEAVPLSAEPTPVVAAYAAAVADSTMTAAAKKASVAVMRDALSMAAVVEAARSAERSNLSLPRPVSVAMSVSAPSTTAPADNSAAASSPVVLAREDDALTAVSASTGAAASSSSSGAKHGQFQTVIAAYLAAQGQAALEYHPPVPSLLPKHVVVKDMQEIRSIKQVQTQLVALGGPGAVPASVSPARTALHSVASTVSGPSAPSDRRAPKGHGQVSTTSHRTSISRVIYVPVPAPVPAPVSALAIAHRGSHQASGARAPPASGARALTSPGYPKPTVGFGGVPTVSTNSSASPTARNSSGESVASGNTHSPLAVPNPTNPTVPAVAFAAPVVQNDSDETEHTEAQSTDEDSDFSAVAALLAEAAKAGMVATGHSTLPTSAPSSPQQPHPQQLPEARSDRDRKVFPPMRSATGGKGPSVESPRAVVSPTVAGGDNRRAYTVYLPTGVSPSHAYTSSIMPTSIEKRVPAPTGQRSPSSRRQSYSPNFTTSPSSSPGAALRAYANYAYVVDNSPGSRRSLSPSGSPPGFGFPVMAGSNSRRSSRSSTAAALKSISSFEDHLLAMVSLVDSIIDGKAPSQPSSAEASY
jgi:hypothetical protein